MSPAPVARRFTAAAVVGAALLFAALQPLVARRAADSLPTAIPDHDFWALTQQLSEPNGYFMSRSGSTDNLLSNELTASTVASALASRVKPGGVYLGVGPEQNFTYIAASRPRIAFIVDVRRGNLDLQLLYKAVFDLSPNRAAFVARLFGRQPLTDVPATADATALMDAALRARPLTDAAFTANLNAVMDNLKRVHGMALSPSDVSGIEYVSRAFHRFGPDITYTSTSSGRSWRMSNYATIMESVDPNGAERGYLATEPNFQIVKTMERNNLIVPVVGDFAGPKALRAIGAYVRDHGATVTMFYVSNVEQYLQANGVWPAFCANVASLPIDGDSIFIRPGSWSAFSSIANETSGCHGAAPAGAGRRGR